MRRSLGSGSAGPIKGLVAAWENRRVTSVLTVISGLPASGKSTVASAVAQHTATPYLRVDRIEQAIVAWSSIVHPVGPVGYAVAHQIAAEQLGIGLDVIVECVNPVAVTRDGWMGTATAAGAAVVEVELLCSDPAVHRRRVETRPSDVEGLDKPTWQEVLNREYETWSRPHLVIDTATMAVEPIVDRIVASVAAARTKMPSSSSR
jgi:predicted kinase